ncbi:MAG TPA: alpha/beta hydrolase [Acidimicrobiales bacterium]|nr:alpha/beta hydrolase [Acidimicrobiales bacterium]
MDATTRSVSLDDGRVLEVRTSGPEDGIALVFHHGTPGSATPLRALERAAQARGLRLVSFSRPGYGGSSRRSGRRIVDVVADTAAVLEALGVERCLVAGWSGGGPHALACAARLEQVSAALVVAGVGPYGADGLDFLAGMGEDNLVEFGAALEGEERLRDHLVLAAAAMSQSTGSDVKAALESLLAEADRGVLTGEVADDLASMFTEAVAGGVEGWLDDDLAFTAPWGFSLEEISCPTSIWQGEADLMVPLSHGRFLAGAVPGADVHLEADEGHLSIVVGAVEAMLDHLLRAGT